MEQNFQTSFIPKKPMIEKRSTGSRPVGFFTAISFFVLLAVVLGSGGLYFYNGIITKNIGQLQNDLDLAKNRFEPAKIVQLQVLDKRLIASNEILSKHIAISPIFEELQLLTMKTIRYTKFSYNFDTERDKKVAVKMSGQAVGYRSVALQSDLFAKNKYFLDPVFSNLSLDEKGNVLFDLDFSVDLNFVNYKRTLLTESENSLNTPDDNGEMVN